MKNRFVLSAVAAVALYAATLPVLAQGRVYDRNASNNPEIYQQTHPEDRSNPQLQGPAPAQQPAPARNADRPDRGRDAGRAEAARNEAARREQDRNNAVRQEADRRQGERRNWDRRAPERREYGYVVPRPYYYGAPPAYYGAPPVYYSAPPVYYGSLPQTYYPYSNGAPFVFQTGDYLPPEYRNQQFVVQDWEWRGLSVPPYGYQWMLLGPDNYALVAASTGQIVSLVAIR